VRVLLVHPARGDSIDRLIRLPPLGLACVAGALRAAGHEPRILDAAVAPSWRARLDAELLGWRPHVVGLTASSAAFDAALEVATLVRQALPRAPVILGGVHATLFPGEVLREPALDYAVHGEGELTVVELAGALARGESPRGVAGIALRDAGGPRVNPPRAPVADLDSLPRPAYDLLPMSEYATPFSAAGRVTSLVTSRGCPYRCSFCDAWVVMGRKYRAHSAERVVEEIAWLARDFGVRELLFKDSEFTLDRARGERFCELMREGPRVSWTCSARVDAVDEPLLRRMAAAGCRVVQLGVESADPDVLRALRKGIRLDRVRSAFAAARAAGIQTVANLMVGTPGETWDSIEATRRLVAEIRPDHLNVQVFVPYPGTELHRTLGGRSPVSPDEGRRRRRRLLRSFYLRPGRVAGRVLTLRPRHWRQNLAAAAQMLGLARG
jgi:anaerobic magnesium-protoporphyrin IX monomethyl ester cyclase